MKIEEYVERFDCAPIELEELAQSALNVEDDEAFVAHAKTYLDAMRVSESALADRGWNRARTQKEEIAIEKSR